jgi:hypothetical protein
MMSALVRANEDHLLCGGNSEARVGENRFEMTLESRFDSSRDELFVIKILSHCFGLELPIGTLCVFRRCTTIIRNQSTVLLRRIFDGREEFAIGRWRRTKHLCPAGLVQTTVTFECLRTQVPVVLDIDDEEIKVIGELVQILG